VSLGLTHAAAPKFRAWLASKSFISSHVKSGQINFTADTIVVINQNTRQKMPPKKKEQPKVNKVAVDKTFGLKNVRIQTAFGERWLTFC
jgi:hypothetical protein